ncbi:GntR family transcriptional regulator [Dactylosporangium sp. CA-092794]|uniref:GntR family transcriptional regulator n=1 Tax=Dactylosporangium sp. CA-092794 TaxID=3239929 RepID=UPI003D906DBF
MSESVSRADQVAEELRQAIIARVYTPGERLSATALGERFQVSQTPLREAFARLAGEGWVAYLPQRGVRVADVSIADMVDIYDLREQLEPLAMSRSANAGGEAWRKQVQEFFDEMLHLADSEPADLDGAGFEGYELAHTNFHRVLMQECGSPWLIRFTNLLIDQSTRYRSLAIPMRDRLGALADEHDRMRRAAFDGDADQLAKASRQHMQNTRQAILDWLAAPEPAEAAQPKKAAKRARATAKPAAKKTARSSAKKPRT